MIRDLRSVQISYIKSSCSTIFHCYFESHWSIDWTVFEWILFHWLILRIVNHFRYIEGDSTNQLCTWSWCWYQINHYDRLFLFIAICFEVVDHQYAKMDFLVKRDHTWGSFDFILWCDMMFSVGGFPLEEEGTRKSDGSMSLFHL